MKLAHIALWTTDLDAAVTFWEQYFCAEAGGLYFSQRRPGFVSRFLALPGCDSRIELMTAPWLASVTPGDNIGWDHIAISLGSAEAVDRLASRCDAGGCLVSRPRLTGDGFYEAVVSMPDGTLIEVTA